MNKILRYCVVVACVGTLFSSFSVPDSQARNIIIQRIVSRMEANNRSLRSFRSDLKLLKFDSLLKTSEATIGSASFLPKSKATRYKIYLRVDWTWPEEQLCVIGDNFELYRPKINQLVAGNLIKLSKKESLDETFGFLSMSASQLKANFNLNYLGRGKTIDGIRMWHLRLKSKTMTTYKSAELWVNKSGMPRQVKVTLNNNDTTTLLLSGIQTNIKLEGKIFKLSFPRSIQKIRM